MVFICLGVFNWVYTGVSCLLQPCPTVKLYQLGGLSFLQGDMQERILGRFKRGGLVWGRGFERVGLPDGDSKPTRNPSSYSSYLINTELLVKALSLTSLPPKDEGVYFVTPPLHPS